jgi:nucleoporin p58/p45
MQTGGLFGGGTTTLPTQTGGLVGGGTTQATQTSSIFSSNSSQNPTKPTPTFTWGGLGNNQNQNTNQNQQSQSQPQQPSLFNASQQQQPQTQTSNILGGGTLGGGLTMGQSTNQPSQTVPGVTIDASQIRSTTRFNDLHENIQKSIMDFDKVIQAQIQLKYDCDAIMPSHNNQLSNVPHDVDFLTRKLNRIENAMETDAESIALVREYLKTDAENAKLSFRAIDNLKLPAQYHTPGIWSKSAPTNASQRNGEGESQDIVGLFSTTADELSEKLAKYQKNLSEIEQHLRGVEASSAQQMNALIARRNGGAGVQDDPLQELAAVLREFESGILGVAGQVGSAREGVQRLQLGDFIGSTDGKSTGKRSGVY